jgi:hypothetical protein
MSPTSYWGWRKQTLSYGIKDKVAVLKLDSFW